MRGERTLRVGTSGWLILAAVALFAVVMASAATQQAPAKSPLERLADGDPVPLTPRTLDLNAREIVHESLTVEGTVWDTGEPMANPLGGPGPEPMDPPFGAEVKVHPASPDAQTEPSVAGDATGSVLIAAYTEQIAANRNIVVGRSTDGGTVWTRISVASAAYNEFDPRVVWHGGSRFYVFYSMDDAATPRGFRYAVSTNGGTSWTINLLNYGGGAPFRDLRTPDASYSGQWLYAVYAVNCDIVGPTACGPAPNLATVTIMFDAGGVVVPPSIYFPFGINIIEPAIQANDDQTLWIADIDGSDPGICGLPGSHDVIWINTQTGLNTGPSWLNAFITGTCSNDFVRVDASGLCPTTCPPIPTGPGPSVFNFPYQFIGGPFPNHAVVNLFSADSGSTWTLDLIAGVPGIEFKDPAAFARVPLFHVSFWSAGDLFYTYTLDLTAGWAAPLKVNSNTGTVVDGFRANDVTYAGGVRACWQDTRDGSSDVFCSDFSGFAFYIFDKNPRQGTIDIDAAPTPVATAFLWATGEMHVATCPSPDPGLPGVRYVFQQWSDADTNPTKSITVGSVDVTLVCIYTTEYFLDISTPVGTTIPVSGWYPAGAAVTIEWISPAPGACVRYSFGGWTGNGPGSFTGPTNRVGITMNGPITEVADATREFCFVFDAIPNGIIQLTIDGTPWPTPHTEWWVEGSGPHTVTADSPQSAGNPNQRFVFAQWVDGPLTPTRSITATMSINLTARYDLENRLVITATPMDCDFSVDSTTYAGGPQTLWFNGAVNPNHNVDVPLNQLQPGGDTRYQFGSWSDGGARSHTIDMTVPQTLDLVCTVEYRHIFDTNPTSRLMSINGGPQVTAPQTVWWASGSTNNVSFPSPQAAGADSRYVFLQWSDGALVNPRTFPVSGPATLTIQTALEHRVRFVTVPATAGISLLVNSNPVLAPGEAWLRDQLPATIEAPTTSPDAADPLGTRYVFQSWSDGQARQHTIFVTGPGTYTATYGTEYFLDIVSPYANIVGEGWYPAGTNAIAGLDAGTVAGPTDTQYVFVQWMDDASGAVFSGSSQITMNSAKLATAQWKTQYYLRVTSAWGTPSGQGWKDAGSTATAGVTPTTVPGPAETRYVFVQWSGGATGTGGTSAPITMDAPKTATAVWKTQFHVTILAPPAGVVASCSTVDCWFDENGIATVMVDRDGIESVPGQTRLGFITWTTDATGTSYSSSNPISMNAPKTVGSTWQTQHKLTITSAQAGVTTPGNSDGWYVEGTVANLAATDPLPDGTSARTRHRFVSWSGAATGIALTAQVTMSDPQTVTATWRTQYEVTVVTSPAGVGQVTLTGCESVAGDWWCDVGDSVQVSIAAELQSAGKTYKFVSWTAATGDAAGGSATVSGPLDIVATFREAGLLENVAVLGSIIAIIVAAIVIALFLLWRRKKEPEEAPAPVAGAPLAPTGPMPPPPPPTMAPGTMECPSCGLTIEAKTGPCPICGTEVVAPAAPARDERIGRLEEAYKSGRISKEQYQANLKKMRGNT